MSITPDYWTDAALARLRAALAEHMAPQHSFGARWTDAPSIQPDRIPAHRAPKHRADRHEGSCGLACDGGWEGGVPCSYYRGEHRAEVAA